MARPNILLILCDDMGYSDIGCYGGEVRTLNLDELSANGLRFTQFYNTARCCPSRASLLTGLHPHQTGVGHMTRDSGFKGYRGDLNFHCVTIAEVLRSNGYSTYMSGKWHVTRYPLSRDGPKHNWPCQRGFDHCYHVMFASYFNPSLLAYDNRMIECPKGEYYSTDAITSEMCNLLIQHEKKRQDKPFFAYVAYTAPHWPLHALPEDIKRYKGHFDMGWDKLREQRFRSMVEMGIINKKWKLSLRDPKVPEWNEEEHKEWQTKRMEVYAAQIDRMDQGIGHIIQTLKENNQLGNTLILFLSDNGGCAEELLPTHESLIRRFEKAETRDGRKILFGNNPDIMPGAEDTYQSYGLPWANVSNTPFREYKHWVHEGGTATPLIVHWPEGIEARGQLRHQPGQLPDIMATCLDAAGAEYPTEFNGHNILPLEGHSLKPVFEDKANDKEVLYFEHEGNRAVRKKNWKLVCKYPGQWELYDLERDGTELNNLAERHYRVVRELSNLYNEWAKRCNVLPWDQVVKTIR